MPGLVVVLDNIRSCANVGVILRTATAFGFDKAIHVGTTPKPDRKEVIKAALGGQNIDWEYTTTLEDVAQLPRPIVIIETAGTDIFTAQQQLSPLKSGTIIVGSERGGVSDFLQQSCDYHLSIIHHSQIIRSLNVASAFAIAAAVLTTPE